ncbi:MAG TPA: PQQ-dependent sugar dehydrogenase [Ilumatobacteraceae bacterium]|nr:PQQ-dependent sugar dehydrogenase [Ilumatobacteraceae bacterium]
MKPRRSISLCVIGLLAVAAASCSSSDSSEPSTAGVSSGATTPATSTAAPADTSATGSPTTSAAAAEATTTVAATTPAPLGDPVVALTQLGSFEQPVEVAWRPTDGAMYVVEQDGKIVMMTDGQPGAVALDMTDLTSADGERGLLGLAITKDGALAYVNYTNNDGNTRIDEYSVDADGTFDKATRREVLGFDQPYPNHNGGDVVFGPDNMLYIGTGDGGSGGDPDRRALNPGELLGKMLRIDPHASAGAAYTVPPDNPFVGVEGARPEIWAIGFRNPWRYSFDRSTGDLWISDVGQNQWEEVDAAWAADGGGKGANYGWSAMEGNHQFNADQSADGAIPPMYEYEHVGQDCSISGSALYRGTAIPALVGYYVFADYCSGQVRSLQIADRAVTKMVPLGKLANVTAVNEGPDGELYVVTSDGPIYAVTPA